MSQIQAGHTYTSTGTNSLVTASNLNQHVNNAQLVGGAIVEQPINAVSADTDLLLIAKAGSLYSQTKLQFSDTLNSQTINVNDLSVDTASIDSLTLSHTVGSVLDLGLTNVVVKGAYPQMRFGFDAYAPAPTGSSYLDQVYFATRVFQISNPAYSTSGPSTLQVIGNVSIQNQPTYTGAGNLSVAGDTTIEGDLVVNGSLTVAETGPKLKAMGSWTWDGTNLNARRTPYNCSITRLGVGNYKVTFTTAMSNAGYTVSALTTQWGGNIILSVGEVGTRTTMDCTFQIQDKAYSSSGGAVDSNLDILIFD